MIGIIFSIIAGLCMSFQGVFNTRLGEKIGTIEANLFVQGTGLILTLILFFIACKGRFKNIVEVNKLYLLGGVLGVAIIFCVMGGMKFLGPSYAVSIILVSQLLSAAFIDAFALFDSEKIIFGFYKIIGIAIMVLGIVIFKWKG